MRDTGKIILRRLVIDKLDKSFGALVSLMFGKETEIEKHKILEKIRDDILDCKGLIETVLEGEKDD